MTSETEVVTLEAANASFKHEVAAMPGGESVKKCFSCGTCTSGCPVFRVEDGYNPRRILRLVLLGLRREVLSSGAIWLCARCYKCTANCPQGVNFADIMRILQDMAVAEGFAAPELREQVENVTDAANRFRAACIKALTGRAEGSAEELVESLRRTLAEAGRGNGPGGRWAKRRSSGGGEQNGGRGRGRGNGAESDNAEGGQKG